MGEIESLKQSVSETIASLRTTTLLLLGPQHYPALSAGLKRGNAGKVVQRPN
jgi:hypothetical protein